MAIMLAFALAVPASSVYVSSSRQANYRASRPYLEPPHRLHPSIHSYWYAPSTWNRYQNAPPCTYRHPPPRSQPQRAYAMDDPRQSHEQTPHDRTTNRQSPAASSQPIPVGCDTFPDVQSWADRILPNDSNYRSTCSRDGTLVQTLREDSDREGHPTPGSEGSSTHPGTSHSPHPAGCTPDTHRTFLVTVRLDLGAVCTGCTFRIVRPFLATRWDHAWVISCGT
mmetsp:Transcript_20531/g.44359  ORF Transcript_20531/g.44359 Transcript_20531/m.44359 type:complete len:224 (-) Transcript_20531:852-1523(-)